jgi:excisionase family DNA binding protein
MVQPKRTHVHESPVAIETKARRGLMIRTVNNLRVGQLLLTPRQAAQALQISERKLWSMKASGEIPHVLLGRSVRYPLCDLQQWIDERKTGGVR